MCELVGGFVRVCLVWVGVGVRVKGFSMGDVRVKAIGVDVNLHFDILKMSCVRVCVCVWPDVFLCVWV